MNENSTHGFYGCFLDSVRRFPGRTAAELQRSDGTLERYSYSDLRRMGESVGHWLQQNGLRQGGRCALLASNGPIWVAAYLGAMAAGAADVPLDTAFNPQQVRKLLADSGSSFLFTDEKHLPVAEAATSGTQVRIVMLDRCRSGAYPGVHDMFAAGPRDFRPAELAGTDLAVLMYTSGTTSDPKGVMLSHRNLLAEADAVFSRIQVTEQDSILGVLPLFHALAQMANLLLPFAVGARVVYLESLNTVELMRALGERDITLFCCVPQFFYLIHERVLQQVGKRGLAARLAFRAMMAISRAGRAVGLNPGRLFFRQMHRLLGPRMRYLITGGSAFDVNIGRDLRTLGFEILQAYGLTETSGGASCTPPGHNVLGSVGPPLKGVEVKIVDPQPSEDLQRPVGEIALHGGIVMEGYYNRPDPTAAAIRDGWLLTGDLGYVDERGNIFITGRRKEIIVLSSGKNIYPEEIETHYLKTPFIKEICVLGLQSRPGEPVSERLHAVIVPNFDVLRERRIVNAKEVIRFDVENLSMQLPSTKRILSFEIWPDPLPRTTTRKLKRFEIQKRVLAGGGSESATEAASSGELTEEEALWMSNTGVQKAIDVIRRHGKAGKPVLPSSNLELDLGFDSMERVELVVELERELSAHVDEQVISQVYTVRELVDTILGARNGAAARAPMPGWDVILAQPPEDPKVLQALNGTRLGTVLWFLLGRLALLFIRPIFRLRISGLEKLPREGPFILSPNHQSFLDGPIVAALIPWPLFKRMFYVGTSEIFGQGVFAWLGKTFRLVPVDPDSNLVNAMRAGAHGLRQRNNLVLYPEGERSIDGTPKKFKKGAAILSAHLKVPIYPVALDGFYDAWPRGRRFPCLSRLRVRFGDPILPPQEIINPEKTYQELTDNLRAEVVAMWEELKKES